MFKKFPQNKSAELVIFRKLTCLLLSFALIAVQSGCYTTRVAQSLNPEETVSPYAQPSALEAGQFVRITYMDGRVTKRWEGKFKAITVEGIIIPQRQPGKLTSEDIVIPLDQIKQVEILDKKLDVVATVMGGTLVGILLVFSLGLVLVGYLRIP